MRHAWDYPRGSRGEANFGDVPFYNSLDEVLADLPIDCSDILKPGAVMDAAKFAELRQAIDSVTPQVRDPASGMFVDGPNPAKDAAYAFIRRHLIACAFNKATPENAREGEVWKTYLDCNNAPIGPADYSSADSVNAHMFRTDPCYTIDSFATVAQNRIAEAAIQAQLAAGTTPYSVNLVNPDQPTVGAKLPASAASGSAASSNSMIPVVILAAGVGALLFLMRRASS